jgi:1,4-dihydroxy-2-naphthoate octaprenyltransferase
MDMRIIRFLLQITRPVELLGGLLVYALGVGIAHYLGSPIDWTVVAFGQAWVTIYQLGFHILSAYFLLPLQPGNRNRISISLNDEESNIDIRRDHILWAALATFAAVTSITLILMNTNGVNASISILQGIFILGAILYCVPPFRLVYSGYGELIKSIIIANLIPTLAFVLQNDEFHRLVGMSTFPLTMTHLAMLLAIQFPGFFADVKTGNQTLLVRLGWERGMNLHNILILSAFLLIGIAMLFGLPAPIALPVFIVLPLGLFQIWYMTRIAAGAKPFWRVLRISAILTYGLMAYLFTFSFWIR